MTENRGASPAPLRWSHLEQRRPLTGITAARILGERLSAAMFDLVAGAVVPSHRHDNEEFGQVLRGSLELTCGSETFIVAAGEGFLVPPGVPHAARAGADGCQLLECYAPPRDPVPAQSGSQG